MNAKRKNILLQFLNIIGTVISIVLISSVLYQLINQDTLQTIKFSELSTLVNIILGIFFYFTSVVMGAFAWHILFSSHSEKPISTYQDVGVFCYTQIQKYLPANVFHYVGRFVYLQNRGYAQSSISVASLHEIVLLLSSASLFTIPIVYLYASDVLPNHFSFLLIGLLIIASGIVLAAKFSTTLRLRIVSFLGLFKKRISVSLQAFLIYSVAFVVLGFSLNFILLAVNTQSEFNPIYLSFVFAGAWTLGLITPGASAGIGVRETLLIFLLSGYTTDSNAIAISVLMRIVSVVGDISIWIFGIYLIQNAQPINIDE